MEAKPFANIIAITLGTSFGVTFIRDKKNGEGVPTGGVLCNVQYKDGIAEDCISGAWLLHTCNSISGNSFTEVLQIAKRKFDHQYQNARHVSGNLVRT